MDLADFRKIEYAKRRLRRNYVGDDLATGPLTTDKHYRITKYGAGDDFKNVGASSNASDQLFKATGTAPATWSHGSILNEIKLDALKNDADIVFESAIDPVTLTGANFEGGSGSGQITFARDLLGVALEELIEEFDPDWSPPPGPRVPRPMGIRASVY